MEYATQREPGSTEVSRIRTLTLICNQSTPDLPGIEANIIEPFNGYNRLYISKTLSSSTGLPSDLPKSCAPALNLLLVQLTGETTSHEDIFGDCYYPSNNGSTFSYLNLTFLSISQGHNLCESSKCDSLSVLPFLVDLSNELCVSFQGAMDDVQVEVFHSIGYGDFCVVLKSNTPISGSRLLPYIQNLELNRHGGNGFPSVICHVLKMIRTALKDCKADQYEYDVPCGEMCPNWSLLQVESSLVEEKLARLERKVLFIPAPYQAEYLKCCQLMLQLWAKNKRLSTLAQSFSDGRFFLLQIWLLLCTADKYTDEMISKDKGVTNSNIHTLLEHMRTAAVSIDRFQRQTTSDCTSTSSHALSDLDAGDGTRKYIIAYSEFARCFLLTRFSKEDTVAQSIFPTSSEDNGTQYILPIFSIDPNVSFSFAMPLFLAPYHAYSENQGVKGTSGIERLLLPITVPSRSIFENLYAVFPLVAHELSHNFRIMDREKRNEALTDFIITKVCEHIIRQWVSNANTNRSYSFSGRLEQDMLSASLCDILKEKYIEQYGDISQDGNIGVVQSNLLDFLFKNVLTDRDQYTRTTPNPPIDVVRRKLEQLVKILQLGCQDELSAYAADWQQEYHACLEKLKEAEKSTDQLLPKDLITDVTQLLLGEIVPAIHFQLIYNIVCAARKVEQWVDGKFPSNDKVKEVMAEFEKSVCAKSDLRKDWSKCISPALTTDEWVCDFFKELKKDAHDVYKELTSGKSPLVNNEYRRALRDELTSFTYMASYCCQQFKNVGILCDSLLIALDKYKLFQEKHRIPLFKSQNDILDELYDLLQTTISNEFDNKEDIWLLYSSEQMQELFAHLGIDSNNSSRLKKSLTPILNSCYYPVIESIVNESVILYREAFADLGMCAALGLNAFGYLRVLALTLDFHKNDLNNVSSQWLDRLLLVIYTLAGEADIADILCRNCMSYIAEEKKAVGYEPIIQRLFKVDCAQLFSFLEECLMTYSTVTEEELVKLIQKCADGEESGLCRRLRWLLITVYYSRLVMSALQERIDAKLKDHMKDLLGSLKGQFQNANSESHAWQLIGEMYNRAKDTERFFQNEQQAKDTLTFVLDYYYRHWKTFGALSFFADDNSLSSWMDTMIGEEP